LPFLFRSIGHDDIILKEIVNRQRGRLNRDHNILILFLGEDCMNSAACRMNNCQVCYNACYIIGLTFRRIVLGDFH